MWGICGMRSWATRSSGLLTQGRVQERWYALGVQNYIDNTGVQVADVVVGLTALEEDFLWLCRCVS